MRIILTTCFALLFGYTCFSQYDHLRKEINTLIKYETSIDYKSTPGFIVGMIDGDSTYILPFGHRSLDEAAPILQDDIFELGGITKIFTAMIVMSMVQENKLDLYVSINNYLRLKNPTFDSCTLFKLLTHTSGLPKYPAGWGSIEKDSQDPYAAFDQKELDDFYIKYKLHSLKANDYLYSHLNYVLITWVLESVSGLKFSELLKMYLPNDLNVSNTLIPTVAGYGLNVKSTKPWNMTSYAGSIGAKGSLVDLLNTCHHFLRDTAGYQTMMHPYETHIGKSKSWVALGWQALPIVRNRFIFAHNGKTHGHHAFIAMLPDTKTAVVILANSAKGSDVLGLNILDMMNNNWKRKSIDIRQ